jgi:hypothetical protein
MSNKPDCDMLFVVKVTYSETVGPHAARVGLRNALGGLDLSARPALSLADGLGDIYIERIEVVT